MTEKSEILQLPGPDLCIEIAGTPWKETYSVVDGMRDVLHACGYSSPRPRIYSVADYFEWQTIYGSVDPSMWETYIDGIVERVFRARQFIHDGGRAAYEEDVRRLEDIHPMVGPEQEGSERQAFLDGLQRASSGFCRSSFENRFLHLCVGGSFHALAILEACRIQGDLISSNLVDELQRRLLKGPCREDVVFLLLMSPEDLARTSNVGFLRELAMVEGDNTENVGESDRSRSLARGLYNMGAMRVLEMYSNELPPVEMLVGDDEVELPVGRSSLREELPGVWMGKLLAAMARFLPELADYR